MYAIIKENYGNNELYWLGYEEEEALNKLIETIENTISNAYEYSYSDWESIKEKGYENYGSGKIYITEDIQEHLTVKDISDYDEDLVIEVFPNYIINEEDNIESYSMENLGFEITLEDIDIVLDRMDLTLSNKLKEEIFDVDLDFNKIEKEALRGDDLDIQTSYALEEIEKQLKLIIKKQNL